MSTAAKTPAPRHLWQDLLRDWRRCSAVERVAAAALVGAAPIGRSIRSALGLTRGRYA
jgi:hypothetical protein